MAEHPEREQPFKFLSLFIKIFIKVYQPKLLFFASMLNVA